MSDHEDIIRDVLAQSFIGARSRELAARSLDALVAESEEDGLDLMSMQERIAGLLAENQRLRDALAEIATIAESDWAGSLGTGVVASSSRRQGSRCFGR